MKKAVAQAGVGIDLAAEVSEQYARAQAGLWEVVKFGAVLLWLERNLPGEQARNSAGVYAGGDGLKAWLAGNCPEINYKTASRYKALAEGLQAEVRLGVRADLHRLLTANETDLRPAERRKREAISDLLAGKSQRQLLFGFAAARRVGAQVGNQNARGATPPDVRQARLAQAAVDDLAQSIDLLTNLAASPRRLGLIDEDPLDAGLERLTEILNKLIAYAAARRGHSRKGAGR